MRNKPLVFTLVGVPLIGCAFFAFFAATSSFIYRHPAGDVFDVRSDGIVMARELRAHDEITEFPLHAPVAQVDQTEYDFGLMDPLTMGRHAFVITNAGSSPLKLQQGPTSCKCTLSNISRNALEPGDTATVTLEWNTGRKFPVYSHYATVYTNDPQHKTIELQVQGIVRRQLGLAPELLAFKQIHPDKPTSATVALFSQTWSSFEIVGAVSSIAGVEWTSRPLPPSRLPELAATSGREITVTLPPGLAGDITGRLLLTLQPTGSAASTNNAVDDSTVEDVVTFEVPIAGHVLGRLAFFGPDIDAGGLIDFGKLPVGKGARKRFVAKVRDEQHDLKIVRVTANPDFIRVKMTSYDGAASSAGLSYLDVEIPADAPPGVHSGVTEATIKIEFDHPRIKSTLLRAAFAVVK